MSLRLRRTAHTEAAADDAAGITTPSAADRLARADRRLAELDGHIADLQSRREAAQGTVEELLALEHDLAGAHAEHDILTRQRPQLRRDAGAERHHAEKARRLDTALARDALARDVEPLLARFLTLEQELTRRIEQHGVDATTDPVWNSAPTELYSRIQRLAGYVRGDDPGMGWPAVREHIAGDAERAHQQRQAAP